jgi:hypothetical protein
LLRKEDDMDNMTNEQKKQFVDCIYEYLREYICIWDCDKFLNYPKWDFINDGLPLEIQNLLADKHLNNVEKNIIVKKNLHRFIANTTNDDDRLSLGIWVIKRWGGINRINDETIKRHIENADNIKTEANNKFEGLSSFSKIASYIYPREYVVIDSRVVCCINNILRKSKLSKLYVKPLESQIQVPCIYETEFKHNPYFIHDLDSYRLLCSLIIKVNLKLVKDLHIKNNAFLTNWRDYPFYTEMMLFYLSKEFYPKKNCRENLNTNISRV